MKLDPNPCLYPFVLEPQFVHMINSLLKASKVDSNRGVLMRFRRRDHAKVHADCRAIDVVIDSSGKLLQVISYESSSSVKRLIFDFSLNTFQQSGCQYELVLSYGIFVLVASCLAAYVESGEVTIEVSPL